jgi:uncharacterized protein (TIGR03118 family)
MRTKFITSLSSRQILFGLAALSLSVFSSSLMTGCSSSTTATPAPAVYTNTVLSSDNASLGGTVDANLKNSWGLVFVPNSSLFFVANNHSGVFTQYDTLGGVKNLVITAPSHTGTTGGSVTGITYNSLSASSPDFTIPNNGAAQFIAATEDGIIIAGNTTTAFAGVKVADRNATSIFKGLAISGSTLLVANFKGQTVDKFDNTFKFQTSVGTSTGIPPGYAPFNIASVDGKIFVTYARQKMANADGSQDDSAAVGTESGIGYVDIFNADGTFEKHFASQGKLNSPWGVVKAPSNFGKYSNNILIGNFGDGTISAYDGDGNYQGQLSDAAGVAVKIPGLWALAVSPVTASGKIYYTAGPNNENDGVVGYIQLKP